MQSCYRHTCFQWRRQCVGERESARPSDQPDFHIGTHFLPAPEKPFEHLHSEQPGIVTVVAAQKRIEDNTRTIAVIFYLLGNWGLIIIINRMKYITVLPSFHSSNKSM